MAARNGRQPEMVDDIVRSYMKMYGFAGKAAVVSYEHYELLDESQIEVTKDLVKFKRFSTKEECQEFRKVQREQTGMIWSEEHESPKGGWFVAYSKPGELVVKAVEETTQYYKLKVPLSADYVVGTGWDNCH